MRVILDLTERGEWVMKCEGVSAAARVSASGKPPLVSSVDLFAGKREVIIEHGDERYRLCITASNKLILIK
jgi:hemin uptake protein HemP